MEEHDNLEGTHGTINESLKMIWAMSYQINYVSWRWPEGKFDLKARLDKDSECPQQWEQWALAANSQKSTSAEDHKILLSFYDIYIYYYYIQILVAF